MRIMSVDFGDSRTGIAVCDKSEMLASPLTVITEYNFQRCAEKVAEFAEKCAEFARLAGELSGIPTELWDERRTTVTAHNYLNETNVRGKKRKAVKEK